MTESKGNSQTRAKNKYNSKNYDSLRIVVKKGKKAIISQYARTRKKYKWTCKWTFRGQNTTIKSIERK